MSWRLLRDGWGLLRDTSRAGCRLGVAAFGLWMLTGPVHGTQVYVQEYGVSPFKTVSVDITDFYAGGAYAGIVKLGVGAEPGDLMAIDGFCIDPFHWSSSLTLLYDVVELSAARKEPGTMDAVKADSVGKLWAMAYAPGMTAEQAAGLQIAIWEIVGGNLFSVLGNDYGASALLAELELRGNSGPVADLVILSGKGQDYVVARSHFVPEGGASLLLFAIALAVIAAGAGARSTARRFASVRHSSTLAEK